MIEDKQEELERIRLENLVVFEKKLWGSGIHFIAGLDEAGRGPLAGPVVAAAVIFSPSDIYISGLNDSKKLSQKKRIVLEKEIKEKALSYGVAYADNLEIDKINILQATKLAMQRAINKLNITPEYLLIDAIPLHNIAILQKPIIKGDSLSASIAAASILAKCERDRVMIAFADKYPEYGFSKHKGYPTKEHYENLAKYGACEIHRKTFRLI